MTKRKTPKDKGPIHLFLPPDSGYKGPIAPTDSEKAEVFQKLQDFMNVEFNDIINRLKPKDTK